MHRFTVLASSALIAVLGAASGCTPREPGSEQAPGPQAAAAASGPASRNAYFGDLHIHTRYSFDAFIFNTRATPDDAYRFAEGEAIDHPAGIKIQLQSGPLDFAAVTDHSEYLGVLLALNDPENKLYPLEIAKKLRGETGLEPRQAFQGMVPSMRDGKPIPELDDREVIRSAWADIVAAAERHNKPGVFTALVGYEFTSVPGMQNLHRNVIFRSGEVPDAPFSSLDSQNPEDLWAWLDARRAEGIEALAIPHNSNGSNGQMWKLTDWAGDPLEAGYADRRMRNEPLVEITQIKGTSETHPVLSPNDEWAGFQIFPYRIATTLPSEPHGSYVREALRNGLEMEERGGFNPFRFGFIGSSDTHVAGGDFEESNYWGKASQSSTPGSQSTEASRLFGSAGLAAVWAEENTRESIYDALRRKETFATSGPRIRVRFFGGFALPDGLAEDPDVVTKAYAVGVPMGSDLAAGADPGAPRFLVWALRDARSAPLQRLQVVKGWVEEGKGREQVYDVACSEGAVPDPANHRCSDNGAGVDLADCSITEGVGSDELRTLWTDPDFDASRRAFYYLRVIENPTCRWSTWDAVRAGVEPNPELDPTIQERAWSSPIWYAPAGGPGGGAAAGGGH